MRYNGKEMNLEQFVNAIHSEWTRSEAEWEEEGIIWAIQDYEGSVGYADFSDEDMQFLKNNELMYVTELFVDDETDFDDLDL